jgi:Dolichyl-phosphate-mannose-protein mannosyltransferase
MTCSGANPLLPNWPARILSFVQRAAAGLRTRDRWPALALVLAASLSLGASIASGELPLARNPWLAAGLWLAALLIVLRIGTTAPANYIASSSPSVLAWTVWERWSLAGLCLLAFVVRAIDLSGNPSILSGNEAGVGLSAIEFVDGRRTNLFSVAWFSFPSLYPFIQSLPLRLLDSSRLAIRTTSVLAGTATVLATYLYARDTFGRRVALLAAGFLTGFGFHVHFSRLGLNNVWDSLFSAALAAALMKAWREDSPRSYLLPGLILGFAQYFYVGTRILAFLLVLWILFPDRAGKPLSTRRWARLGSTAIGMSVAVLPLGLYYLRYPTDFMAPLSRVSLFGYWWDIQTVRYGDPGWWVAGEQAIRSVLGFISVPMTEFYEGQPMLTPLAALLFVVGALISLRRTGDVRTRWLLMWIGGTILTVALSANPPAAQRYVTSAPAVAVLVAIGASHPAQKMQTISPRGAAFAGAALAGMLCLAVVGEGFHYFGQYAARRAFGDYNAETADRIARWLAARPDRQRVYFLGLPWMELSSHETILFLVPGLVSDEVDPGKEWTIELQRPGVYQFVVLPEREDDLPHIRVCFPGGSISRETGRDHKLLFATYEVPIRQVASCSAE